MKNARGYRACIDLAEEVGFRVRSPSLASSVGRIPKNASLERFCPAGRNSTSSVQILLTEMKNARGYRACIDLAEEVGFEPTEPCGSTVFKTAAFNHSAIPPVRPDYIRCLIDAAPSVGILQVSFVRAVPDGASSCARRARSIPCPSASSLFIAVQYVRSANFALRGYSSLYRARCVYEFAPVFMRSKR